VIHSFQHNAAVIQRASGFIQRYRSVLAIGSRKRLFRIFKELTARLHDIGRNSVATIAILAVSGYSGLRVLDKLIDQLLSTPPGKTGWGARRSTDSLIRVQTVQLIFLKTNKVFG